ncbi:MAG: hypothetical protein H7293_13415, partial [Candidatus Saccharibacteria bacterium]|nr:hypothetical protein [Rhodoferax sp.]
MSMTKKSWIKWATLLVVALLLIGGVVRALSARKAQSQALAEASAPGSPGVTKAQGTVELADTDVVKLQTLDLVQGLPISGSLKAVNSAVIKARVTGELQGLTVREGDF